MLIRVRILGHIDCIAATGFRVGSGGFLLDLLLLLGGFSKSPPAQTPSRPDDHGRMRPRSAESSFESPM